MALSEREFKAKRGSPAKRAFRALNINLSKFDESWDRHRGAAVRMMSVVLRDDEAQLSQRVCADEQSVKTYRDAINWFRNEAEQLRRTAKLLDTAAGRVRTVWDRCKPAAPAG
jgi:hypothetical protein